MASKRFWIVCILCVTALSISVWLMVRPGRIIDDAPPARNPAVLSTPPEEERAALLRRKGYVEVPLRPTNEGSLNVVANVNGESWLFFLDTGSTDTMVDKVVPERYKLPTSPSGRLMNAIGGKSEELPKIVMERFALGGLQQRLDATVYDMSGQHRSRIEKNDPLPEGLLGADFLAPCAAILDYNSTRLFLWPPSPTPSSKEKPLENPSGVDLAALLKAEGYHEVPLQQCKNKLICVDAQILNGRARLMVDTGAMASCIDSTAVDRLHLPVEAS